MAEINIEHSVADLDELKWNQILERNSNFLSSSFLQYFEKLDVNELLPFYISVESTIVYGHLITIKGRKAANYWQSKNRFSLKKNVLKNIDFKFFCFGNTHFSNITTFANSKNKINENLLLEIINKIKTEFKVNFFLTPDNFYSSIYTANTTLSNQFTELIIDPDMALSINPQWINFNDYTNAIQSKYKKTCSYTFNSPSYTSLYFQIVVGTGSYTTSTTNMYNKDRFHVPFLRVPGRGQRRRW